MIANRLTPVFVATLLLAAWAGDASARDRWPGHHQVGYDARGYDGHHSGHGHHVRRNRLAMLSGQSLGGASRLVTARRSGDSEDGSIRRFGSIGFVSGGTVFYSNGGGYWETDGGEDRAFIPAPKARIIDVDQAMANGNFAATNGCVFEMGVCVIRGK